MNPWRIFDASHPKVVSYAKVAVIGVILSVAVTLANNERTDKRVGQVAREAAKRQNLVTERLARRVAAKTRAASLAGCERSNQLRRALNDTTITQLQFLRTSRQARLRAVATSTTPAERALNQSAADEYRILIAHSHVVPTPDCEALFPDPTIEDPPPRGGAAK